MLLTLYTVTLIIYIVAQVTFLVSEYWLVLWTSRFVFLFSVFYHLYFVILTPQKVNLILATTHTLLYFLE